MKLNDINTGEILEITFSYMDKECNIELSLFDKNGCNIVVPAILYKDKPILPDHLQDKKITYKTERGFYEYSDFCMNLKMLNDKYIYCINCEEEGERVNRRETYRVFVGEDTIVKHTNDKGEEKTFKAMIGDISISGMSIISSYEMNVGDSIETLYKSETYRVMLQGIIVRTAETNKKNSKLYGIKFNERTEVLGKAIMRRQLENRNKRKGLSQSKL